MLCSKNETFVEFILHVNVTKINIKIFIVGRKMLFELFRWFAAISMRMLVHFVIK